MLQRWEARDQSVMAVTCVQKQLSAEQEAKLQDAFALFDTTHCKKVPSKFIPTLMRSVGLTPTQRELARDMDKVGSRDVVYAEVRAIAKGYLNKTAPEKELFAAFKQVFDKEGTGYVDPAEVKEAAMNVESPLADDEVQQLMQWVGVKDITTLSAKHRYNPQKMALMRGIDFTHFASHGQYM